MYSRGSIKGRMIQSITWLLQWFPMISAPLGFIPFVELLLLFSHSVMSDSFETSWIVTVRLLCPWDFPGKNAGVGCHFLIWGIFLAQRLSLHLLCWRRFLTAETSGKLPMHNPFPLSMGWTYWLTSNKWNVILGLGYRRLWLPQYFSFLLAVIYSCLLACLLTFCKMLYGYTYMTRTARDLHQQLMRSESLRLMDHRNLILPTTMQVSLKVYSFSQALCNCSLGRDSDPRSPFGDPAKCDPWPTETVRS